MTKRSNYLYTKFFSDRSKKMSEVMTDEILYNHSEVKKQSFSKILAWVVLFGFAALLLLSSCKPIDRLNRLQKNHPYLFTEIKDTVIIRDTLLIPIPSIQVDTVVSLQQLRDTVVIEKDGIVTTVYLSGNDVGIENKTKPKEIKVPYEKIITIRKYKVVKNPFEFPKPLFIYIVVLILLFLFYKFFFRR